MKTGKRFVSSLLSLSMLSMLIPIGCMATAGAASDDSFYQDLAQLLSKQDDSFYFDTMELTIGVSTLTLDGAEQQLDVAPENVNSRTMLPIRAIAEAAGATVGYDAASKTVLITGPYGDKVSCSVGESSMLVNSESVPLDSPSYIKNARTYMPVRAVSEALNMNVEWDQESKTVTISAPYQTARVLAIGDAVDTDGLGASSVVYDGSDYWVLQFDSPTKAEAAVETLQAQGVIAAPDRYIPPVESPSSSATLDAADETHYSWGVSDCKFDTFTAQYKDSFASSGVVAVVDTGVDSTHSFLRGHVLSGRDFIDGDNDPDDKNGHGTHVSGTIIDCACDVPVQILPVRVLNASGSGTDATVVAGIRYAADQNADVLNMSLGGRRGSSDVIDAAVTYAIGKGTLVVCAAGNENGNTSQYCPAHITTSGTVIVSAGDSQHKRAYFSNYGDSVDLMAPGVDIKSSIPGGSFAVYSGTSMASPHAAAASILIDMLWQKTLTPAELESKVRIATTGKGSRQDNYFGCGFLDMSNAPAPSSTPTPTPTTEPKEYRFSSSSVTVQAGQTASSKLTVTAVYDDDTTKDVTTDVKLYSSDTSVATVDSDGTIKGIKAGTARINMGQLSSTVDLPRPVTVTVTEAAVTEPTLDHYEFSKSSITLEEGQSTSLTAKAVYSDGSSKNVTSSLVSGKTSVATVSNGTVKGVSAGQTSISVSASGDTAVKGGTYPSSVSVTVNEPEEERYVVEYRYSKSSMTLKVGGTDELTVTRVYSDGSTEDATADVGLYSSNTSIATVAISGSKAVITGAAEGTARISMGELNSPDIQIPSPVNVTVEKDGGDDDDDDSFVRLFWGLNTTGQTSAAASMQLSQGQSIKAGIYGETENGKIVDLTERCAIYSSDESVVTVSSDGTLKAVGKGSCYLGISKAPYFPGLQLPGEIDVIVN